MRSSINVGLEIPRCFAIVSHSSSVTNGISGVQ